MKRFLLCLVCSFSCCFADDANAAFENFESLNKEFVSLFKQVINKLASGDIENSELINFKSCSQNFEYKANQLRKLIRKEHSDLKGRYLEILTNTHNEITSSGIEGSIKAAKESKEKLLNMKKGCEDPTIEVTSEDLEEYKTLVKTSKRVDEVVKSTLDLIHGLRSKH